MIGVENQSARVSIHVSLGGNSPEISLWFVICGVVLDLFHQKVSIDPLRGGLVFSLVYSHSKPMNSEFCTLMTREFCTLIL